MKKVKSNKVSMKKFRDLVLSKSTAKSRLLLISYYLLPQPEVAYVT